MMLVLGCAGIDGRGASDPTRAERALEQADVAAARGRLDEAERQYRRAAETLPDDPRVLAGLVRVLIARGELEDALVFDDRAREVAAGAPRSLAPRERCAFWLAAASGRVDAGRLDAAEIVERIESDARCSGTPVAPVRAELFALEAEQAGAAGDVAARIAALRAAIDADPSRIDLELTLARALLDDDRRHEAIRGLSNALVRHPESLELQRLMLDALGLPTAEAPAP